MVKSRGSGVTHPGSGLDSVSQWLCDPSKLLNFSESFNSSEVGGQCLFYRTVVAVKGDKGGPW